jgi:alkaline phosphatase D
MLGKEQIEWLINGLKDSYSPFKFVCIGGQVLNDAKVYETYINVMPEERQYLLDRIAEEKINGVVFLTGDRHHTELSKWQAPDGTTVWDLTTSPLTSSPGNALNEANSLRVPDTYVGENNFSVLEVTGPEKARVLRINVFNADGKAMWSQEILPK